MMKLFLTVLMVYLSGCATYAWRATASAKTNEAEAHNDCTVKMAVAIPDRTSPGNLFGQVNERKRFMQECMAGQGYELVKVN